MGTVQGGTKPIGNVQCGYLQWQWSVLLSLLLPRWPFNHHLRVPCPPPRDRGRTPLYWRISKTALSACRCRPLVVRKSCPEKGRATVVATGTIATTRCKGRSWKVWERMSRAAVSVTPNSRSNRTEDTSSEVDWFCCTRAITARRTPGSVVEKPCHRSEGTFEA